MSALDSFLQAVEEARNENRRRPIPREERRDRSDDHLLPIWKGRQVVWNKNISAQHSGTQYVCARVLDMPKAVAPTTYYDDWDSAYVEIEALQEDESWRRTRVMWKNLSEWSPAHASGGEYRAAA